MQSCDGVFRYVKSRGIVEILTSGTPEQDDLIGADRSDNYIGSRRNTSTSNLNIFPFKLVPTDLVRVDTGFDNQTLDSICV